MTKLKTRTVIIKGNENNETHRYFIKCDINILKKYRNMEWKLQKKQHSAFYRRSISLML